MPRELLAQSARTTDTDGAAALRRLRWLPYVLALFFFAWSLRAVTAGNVIDSDAARHAMNGAFIHDLVRDGAIWKPIQYGMDYYGRLPALSLPYHPPLYPAIEAAVFTIFGVSLTAARVLIAVAVALSALLFYRLVLSTHGSHLLAVCAVSTFLLWRDSQIVAGDVMLEFPCMVFICAAMLCLRNLEEGLDVRSAVGFAVCSVAAVWTKQHSVFLGMVPFVYYGFRLRPWMLLQRNLLAGGFLFACGVLALGFLALPAEGAGAENIPAHDERWETAVGNATYYMECFRDLLGTIPVALVCLVVLAALLSRLRERGSRPGLTLYWAWAVSAFVVLLGISAFSGRYLFFVYAPLAVIVYDSLVQLSLRISPKRTWLAPSALASACIIAGASVPAPFLEGPSEAARWILAAKPQRILYCGASDGNFIFGVRTLDAKGSTTVIPGDKLPEKDLSPEAFDRFLARYGIQYVVLERTRTNQAYSKLEEAPTDSMLLAHRVPLASSHSRWHGGHLSIYRIKNPAPAPTATIKLPVPRIGGGVQVRF